MAPPLFYLKRSEKQFKENNSSVSWKCYFYAAVGLFLDKSRLFLDKINKGQLF